MKQIILIMAFPLFLIASDQLLAAEVTASWDKVTAENCGSVSASDCNFRVYCNNGEGYKRVINVNAREITAKFDMPAGKPFQCKAQLKRRTDGARSNFSKETPMYNWPLSWDGTLTIK